MGPDVVDVVLCTWSNVAIPAILAGCEMIPFTDTKLQEIERLQSQVAKFALGVASTFPNVSCQSELGLKPFKQLLYERQIKFFFRLLFLPCDRWSHQALLDHMSGTWASPYMSYICSLRTELGIFVSTHLPSFWKPKSSEYFLAKCNLTLSGYQWMRPLETLSRARYVSENELSAVITEFKFDNAGLGNKAPRVGYPRKLFCPVCPTHHLTSSFHVLFVCSSVVRLRIESGIQTFINSCTLKNITLEAAYGLFVYGEDCNGKQILLKSYFERAKCMKDMRQLWLSKWWMILWVLLGSVLTWFYINFISVHYNHIVTVSWFHL